VVFEGLDGSFSSIDVMVMGFYQLNIDVFTVDVGFDCLGTFIIHDIELGLMTTRFEMFNDVFECGYHCIICAIGHWPDNDCIEAVEVGHKNILVIFV